jgi:hypothetical protein
MKKLLAGLLLVGSLSSIAQVDSLIKRASNNEFAGCHVLLNVEGYKQLYVGGSFKGNYVNRRDDSKLEKKLEALIEDGYCREKEYTGGSSIVLKASKGYYIGCSVKLNVEGYNQVYVSGSFSGNYIIKNQDVALENKIQSLIDNGSCREQSYAGGYKLIEEVLNNELVDCKIKTNVEGYLQLYIRGSFSGNYVINKQENVLESRLSSLIDSGTCRYRF